jgi:hypothetical protein
MTKVYMGATTCGPHAERTGTGILSYVDAYTNAHHDYFLDYVLAQGATKRLPSLIEYSWSEVSSSTVVGLEQIVALITIV